MKEGPFDKHPVETYPIAIDYLFAAPADAILLSGIWDAFDETDQLDATGEVFASPVAVIEGTLAKVRVENGIVDHDYTLSVTVSFDTGDVLRDRVLMKVVDNG